MTLASRPVDARPFLSDTRSGTGVLPAADGLGHHDAYGLGLRQMGAKNTIDQHDRRRTYGDLRPRPTPPLGGQRGRFALLLYGRAQRCLLPKTSHTAFRAVAGGAGVRRAARGAASVTVVMACSSYPGLGQPCCFIAVCASRNHELPADAGAVLVDHGSMAGFAIFIVDVIYIRLDPRSTPILTRSRAASHRPGRKATSGAWHGPDRPRVLT